MSENDPRRDDGGPAFPNSGPQWNSSAGMKLRDWFAGQALNGWVASGDSYSVGDESWEQTAARKAYEMADAMLAERAK